MIIGFVKTNEWFRLCFFVVFFTAAGSVLSYFYILTDLFVEPNTKVAYTFLFGFVLMLSVDFFRKLTRAPSNKKLAIALLVSFLAIHYLRWTMYFAWQRSFDWTEDGLHPLFHFVDFMEYFWFLVNESAFPGNFFFRDLLRFNRNGWIFTFYDFELHLHGLMLLGIWLLEILVISGIGMLGMLLNRKFFLELYCSWATFKLLPYPFERFGEDELKRIEMEDLDAILTKTVGEGNTFAQIALCFAGKTKTDYIAIIDARVKKRGKIKYSRPKRVYYIGDENVEKMENTLKETHGLFFEKDRNTTNPGIELVQQITMQEKKGR